MGANIYRQPNVKAMKKNGADVIPVYSGSQTLVDAVSECMNIGLLIAIQLQCVWVVQ